MITVNCRVCNKEFKTYPSKIKSGRGRICSKECKWIENGKRWVENNDWKKTINTQFKKGHEKLFFAWSKKFGRILYKKWIKEIIKRDKQKCTICGINKQLVVHHKKEREKYPDLLMDEKNVITLCRACHCKLHKPSKKCVY
jgi:hypothetical protein